MVRTLFLLLLIIGAIYLSCEILYKQSANNARLSSRFFWKNTEGVGAVCTKPWRGDNGVFLITPRTIDSVIVRRKLAKILIANMVATIHGAIDVGRSFGQHLIYFVGVLHVIIISVVQDLARFIIFFVSTCLP